MPSLPASITRIGSKPTEKRRSHHFPHYKSMGRGGEGRGGGGEGAVCCHGHQSFDPICLKTLCSLSPPPVMLHIKFDQDWPTGLRDIQVRKCKTFVIQGQVTPNWVVWSGPKSNSSELLCLSWLPETLIMIRSKNERASMETAFSHYKSMGFFYMLKAFNSVVSGPIWPNFELVRDCKHVLVTCKYNKDRIKKNRKKVETSFSPL